MSSAAMPSSPATTWKLPMPTANATPALIAKPTSPLRIIEIESCAIVAR